MRLRVTLGVALAVLFGAVGLYAEEELKSGLPVGKSVSPYDVVKCGGAEDGVKVGQKLCYV
jgi:hypothetical protein